MKTALPIGDETIISRKPSLVAADVSDETILLDVDSGAFFQLNVSAAQIWRTIETERSFAELCTLIGAAFSIDPSSCRDDIREFVVELCDRGLLQASA